MTVDSLKKEARRHEQREEWMKALDLYLQAIEAQAGEDEPDIALHNRVGDLQVRLGDIEGAVASYERAIALYVSAELPNNAIAVCRKIVRHDPERPSVYLRMGQIRAQQGFLVDARQNFIAYAEMMQASGEPEEAFRAIEEFAALAPKDVETRLFLAEQLVTREQPREALHYLAEAYRVVAAAEGEDEEDQKGDILSRIREIDPDHPIPEPLEPPAEIAEAKPEIDDTSGDLEMDSLAREPGFDETDAWGQFSGDPGSGDSPEGMIGVADEADETEEEEEKAETEPWAVEDLEITRFGASDQSASEGMPEVGDVEGLESTGLVEEVVEEEESGGEEGREEEVAVTEPAGEDLEAGADWEGAERGHVYEGAEEIEVAAEDTELDMGEGDIDVEDLPLIRYDLEEEGLSDESVPVAAGDGAEEGLEGPVEGETGAAQPTENDGEGWRILGEELFAQEEEEGAWQAMERAYEAFAENGQPEKAMHVVRELLLRDPHRIDLRQRVVEYAHRTNERTVLVQAYLDLAEGLRAAGESAKASAVFEQVLEIDPGNLRANEALSAAVPTEAVAVEAPIPAGIDEDDSSPPAEDGDYVDLGEMVLDSQGEETTRWKIAAEEPTGDEEADFARMLSQFKDKVAENLSGEDARSHYDLGAAYKEMGLLTEAIGEFQQALRAEPGNLAAFEMLGQCFLDQGEAEVAIRTLERGLDLKAPVEDDLLGVYYWLGQAHETVGNRGSAREFYEKIFSVDINFKDVTERLKALR